MRAGDVVWNPLTGEKVMLVESAQETEGARIVGDFAVEAGGFVPGGEHVHEHCAEHFESAPAGSRSCSMASSACSRRESELRCPRDVAPVVESR